LAEKISETKSASLQKFTYNQTSGQNDFVRLFAAARASRTPGGRAQACGLEYCASFNFLSAPASYPQNLNPPPQEFVKSNPPPPLTFSVLNPHLQKTLLPTHIEKKLSKKNYQKLITPENKSKKQQNQASLHSIANQTKIFHTSDLPQSTDLR